MKAVPVCFGLLVLILAEVSAAQVATNSATGPAESEETLDAEIEAAIANRTDEAGNAAGMIVGILTPEGSRYLQGGHVDREISKEPGPDSLFKIGGVSILFSATLLADMAERGEISLDDPISLYVPEEIDVPAYQGQEITLSDLATSTSGLPSQPPLDRGVGYDPSQITVADLYEALDGFVLTRAPGDRYEGSFWGGALIADILARHAGVSFPELLRERVFQPLGMTDTVFAMTDEQNSRAAVAYTPGLNRIEPRSLGAIDLGAGLYSTADDMLLFTGALLGLRENPLEDAMRRTLSLARPIEGHAMASSGRLGWLDLDGNVVFRSASVVGYTASIAVNPEQRHAAVVLINTISDLASAESVALHAVMPAYPVMMYPPKQVLSEISLSAETLDRFVGQYRIDPASDIGLPVEISIRRQGDALFATLGRQRNETRLSAYSPMEFAIHDDDTVRFIFEQDSSGQITRLTQERPVGAPFRLLKVTDRP